MIFKFKTFIILFTLIFSVSIVQAKPAISSSIERIQVGALREYSYNTGRFITNVEIDEEMRNTSTRMASQLNIPIYDNNPKYSNNVGIEVRRESLHAASASLKAKTNQRPSFSDIAKSIQTAVPSSLKAKKETYVSLESLYDLQDRQ